MSCWLILCTSETYSDANDLNLSQVVVRERQEERAELAVGRRPEGAKAQSRSIESIQLFWWYGMPTLAYSTNQTG